MNAEREQRPRGRPIFTDGEAESSVPGLPAFLARPAGAPVYHGFPVVVGPGSDGWALGLISDFGGDEAHYGDGYVIAPDGSRCGLVWECCGDESFDIVIEAEANRWGVYSASLPHPLHGLGDARRFLDALRAQLDPSWQAWASRD